MHASIDSTFSTGDVGADLLSNGTARVRLGDVTVFLHAPADADALIAAAAEAKRLLSPPVITDSERDCDQANPETGAWCHRGGDHGVHRDTDGKEWRTDTVGGVLLPADCDPDNAPEVTS